MERRNSLGCAFAGLGLVLCLCLLPYLASSAYTVATALLDEPAVTRWLWGDWLTKVVEPGTDVYKILAELPICAAGILGLLITVMGVVSAFTSRQGREEPEARELPFELSGGDAPVESRDIGETSF